jgi:signal transduction histidine kinase
LLSGEPIYHCQRADPQILSADGDLTLIRTALSNLLANTWKFTSKTEDPEIEFSSQEKDGEQVYFIRTTGQLSTQ